MPPSNKKPHLKARTSLKDSVASLLLKRGQSTAQFSIRSGQLFWIEWFCQSLAKLSPTGLLLNQIQLFTAKAFVTHTRDKGATASPQKISKAMNLSLGDFKNFVIADLFFRNKNYENSIGYYQKHHEQLKDSKSFKQTVQKILIEPSKKSSPALNTVLPLKGSSHDSKDTTKRTVVYTAIFGDYDTLVDPINPGNFDYICFSDKPLRSDVWKVKTVSTQGSALIESRRYKIRPHKYLIEYDQSIYIDGNLQITGDMASLLQTQLDTSDFSMFSHSLRDCFFDEARAILQLGKAPADVIIEQVQNYNQNEIPKKLGLFEAGIIWRRHHNPTVKQFMDHWWHEFNLYPFRDQLSLAYTMWSLKTAPQSLPESLGNAHKSKFHQRLNHRP